MGYMRHHAVIVTGEYGNFAEDAHAEAMRLTAGRAGMVSPLSSPQVNGAQSFALFPDGSKEGWSDSDEGDKIRSALIAWLETQRYDDGSSPLDWVEVQFGDDEGETLVLRHSVAAPQVEDTDHE